MLLTEINRMGTATIRALNLRTNIPKPTIVRLLETLIEAGYVYKDHRMGGYQVTNKASELSSGYHSGPLVLQAARHWAIDLTRRLKWPVSICTLQRDGVVVQYSTIPDSPISPFHSTIGVKLSLGARAMGRAYLCFCPENERAILYQAMRESPDSENHFDQASLEQIVTMAQRNGYAQRDRKVNPVTSGTIAVPLMLGDRVLATFGITFFRSAVKAAHVEDSLVIPLKQTAAQIEGEIQTLTH